MDETQLNETDVDLNELIRRALKICKKARWLMVLTTLFAVVGVNEVLRFIPSKYRSEATILVLGQQISPNFVAPVGSDESQEESAHVAAYEVLTQSRLLEIVSEFGLVTASDPLPEDAVDRLRTNIEIEPAGPSVFHVSYTAKTPQLAQSVTKKLADLYIERHSALEAKQVENATSLFQDQLAGRRKKLDELQQRMGAFKGQYAGELSAERPENLEDLREARTRLDNVNASHDTAIAQRTVLESTLVATLNARLTRLQDERATLLTTLTAKNPKVVSKDQQIAQVQAEMEEIKAGAKTLQNRQSALASVDPAVTQLEGQLDASAQEIDSLSKEAARQTSRIAEYQGLLNKNPVHEQQLSSMEQEARELNEEIGELEKKEQLSGLAAEVSRREEGQQFRLLDPPTLPTHPSSKKRQTASLATVAVGPLLGFVLTLLLEFRRPTFQSENELRRTFAPPLVLSVPVLQTQRERSVHTWRTGFELFAGCIVVVAIAATELYAYRLLS